MAEFQYTALDERGHEVSGALQAESRVAALSRLKTMGMHPLDIAVSSGGAAVANGAAVAASGAPAAAKAPLFGRRASASDLALFTRQLSSLFTAGLNVVRCLDTLVENTENVAIQQTLREVSKSVQGGSALWEALAEHPKMFSELYVGLVQAGEASGQLGPVLERLADEMEATEERRSKIRSALSYPILLIIAGFSAVLFILIFLVPRFAKIFANLNRPLPAPTKFLLDTQSFVSTQGWWVALLIAAFFIALKQWGKTPAGGLALDGFRMKMPVLGPLFHKESVSRFCRTMATLVQGGVPILSAFDVAERAVGNRVLSQAIMQVKDAVREGEALAPPLRRTGVFPGLVTNMIAVGEETGNLDEMLVRVADAYDAELSNRMRQLVSLVEPAVILIMGGIIGGIVISMLVPVLEISTAF